MRMPQQGAVRHRFTLPLALALLGIPAAGARAQIRVTVNQTPVVFRGQAPIERGGRVLVPVREVLERAGASVRYDRQTETVLAFRGATNITLPVGGRRARVGERVVALETPAEIVRGSVLVPLRFMAEALGARVTWNVGTKTVGIETGWSGTQPVGQNPPSWVDIRVSGTVAAVYPDLSPRRIVVRTAGRPGAPAQDRTIPLRPDATVSVRRPNTVLAITLDRVYPGDTVEVRQTREGQATAVEVLARASAGTRPPVAAPPPTPPRGSDPRVFRGEFLEANRIGSSRWVLKMTDGRLIEVPNSILILYGEEKISVDDLRSGDQVTISVDPRTRRGTRVVVAVEQR